MRRSGWAALLCAAVLGSCAPKALPPPPSAPPPLDEPALALPADLDLMLRLDLARLRAALGIEGETLLHRLQESAPNDEPDADTSRLLFALLAHADTLWIAVRPGLSAELTDGAVALRGDFRTLVPSSLGGTPRWSAARDLGGGLLRFERDAPRLRAAPAVLYLRVPDVVILGSEAEVDALERSVEHGNIDAPLRTPEGGLIAAAARLGSLRKKLSERAPTLSRYLDGAERLEASFDRNGELFRFRVDVGFETAEQVSALARQLKSLQEGLRADGLRWVEQLKIEPLERNLALALELSPAELARLARCFSKPGC